MIAIAASALVLHPQPTSDCLTDYIFKMEKLPSLIILLAIFICTTHGEDFDYGAIVDAGSSGSRMRIYRWERQVQLDVLPDITETYSYKVEPGIADYAQRLDDLEPYLMGLVTQARNNVPIESQNATSIYLMATAGMRLLLEDHANAVIDKIDSILSNKSISPFLYESTNTRILSGEEEGVFGWIQVNYLRGFFNAEEGTMKSKGILEMGGASTQIAFAPAGSILADKFPVKIAGVNYPLYVHSYLYYGQDYAEKWVKEYLFAQNRGRTVYEYPCYPVDSISVDSIEDKNLTFKGTGDAALCLEILNELVYEVADYRCFPKPCAIGTVYQPTIEDEKFFIATSAFLLSLEPLGSLAVDENGLFIPVNVAEAAKVYCSKTIPQIENETGLYGDKFLPKSCLMGVYIPLLLTKGYGFSNTTTQVAAKEDIEGQDAGWTLGAIIYENERKDWSCPVTHSASTSLAVICGDADLALLLGMLMPFLQRFL